jgi:diguanylate cyclase (GGDEF)-like protein
MLAGIDFPWDVRPIIESHHERWDGKGYPHGLHGEAIPLSARILAVADVYDALTSIRSYKDAVGHEAAIEIMRGDAGTAFDPEVFRRFEEVVGTGLGPSAVFDRPSTTARSTTERPDAETRRSLHALPASDPLDELPGRPSIERIAEQALADAALANGRVSLVVVQVNPDRTVRATGRESRRHRALVHIARELRAHTRVTDFIARTGDDQFMVLLPGSPAQHAAWVVQRVEAALASGMRRRGTRDAVGIRTAIVVAPENGKTAEQLLVSADAAIVDASESIRPRGARRARG